ncbi:hypothetical protein SPIRO4BDMA_80155 [uncultured spirochete]|uniref:Uncharacterized protein n=1 Tax=uncultured spirochete TaxID=156406 RepID=A0A3P3XUU3_9SPIR|nr:hypothetical protein SPIRO4BDMA_80155 [uncultured spirochete]
MSRCLLPFCSVHKLEFIEERKTSNERSEDGALTCKHRANLLSQVALTGYARVIREVFGRASL